MKTNQAVKETYKNPLSFATNTIAYFRSNGQHVVAHNMHCGEDIAPNCFRFDDINEARNQWRKIRELLAFRGYTEKCAY